jgi:hypothetical protein
MFPQAHLELQENISPTTTAGQDEEAKLESCFNELPYGMNWLSP